MIFFNTLDSKTVDVNSPRTIFAIVYLSMIGPCVFIIQPGFVAGLVSELGMSEEATGMVVAAEMFGIACTTVLLSLFGHRVSWRRVLVLCSLVSTMGNLASIGQSDPTVLTITRFLTGLGSGGLVSLTFTMMGLTQRIDRNFGFIITFVLIYGSLGLLAMPTALDVAGLNGVLVFFALFCASALPFIRWLPDSGDHRESNAPPRSYPTRIKSLALLGMLLYNVGIGVVWAYLFLVGLEAGMTEQGVANALTISQCLGIAGALVTVFAESRFGRLVPLALGILGGGLSICLLLRGPSTVDYWLAVCGFNFLWNLSVPYLLATLAELDSNGRTVVHGVSMQFVGFAVGPFMAAQLLSRGGYDLVNAWGVGLFIVSAIVFLPAVVAQQRSAGTG